MIFFFKLIYRSRRCRPAVDVRSDGHRAWRSRDPGRIVPSSFPRSGRSRSISIVSIALFSIGGTTRPRSRRHGVSISLDERHVRVEHVNTAGTRSFRSARWARRWRLARWRRRPHVVTTVPRGRSRCCLESRRPAIVILMIYIGTRASTSVLTSREQLAAAARRW